MTKLTSIGRAVSAFLLVGILLAFSVTSRAATQVFAAGKALTNLKTESVYPGAQDPPYICCWNSQGQYVTFTFTVASGPTTFVLRYSASNNNSTRKIELDGATWLPNQVFQATANWSTWATLTLSRSLTAGTHTLTIVFDAPSGSAGYLNLDNLSVTQADSGGGGGTSVTLAAGQALTNLKTESIYPGAQDPPYICCWNSQGQYVTFTFTVAAGSTTFVLHYSASNSNSTRKIELDGTTWLPNQVFPATPNWSTWASLTLSQTLTAGTHTLTIIFDAPSGSAHYLNLDTLTVSQAGSGGGGAGSVTLAAGKAQTNLQTETTWPGAQNPPYICCWNAQGQYVTFTFYRAGRTDHLCVAL